MEPEGYEDSFISDNPALRLAYDHFAHGGSIVAVDCACGLTHFTTASGHGTYDEGEKEKYRQSDKCVEWTNFDTIHYIDGYQYVIGCRCRRAENLGHFVLDNVDSLTSALRELWQESKQSAERIVAQASEALESLPTKPEVDI